MNSLQVHLIKKALSWFPYWFPWWGGGGLCAWGLWEKKHSLPSPLCSAQSCASLFLLCVTCLHSAYVPATPCLQSGLPWKEDLEFELYQTLSGQIYPLPGVTVLCRTKCSSWAFIGIKTASWSPNGCYSRLPLDNPGWPGLCLKCVHPGDRQLGCQASLYYYLHGTLEKWFIPWSLFLHL